MTILAVLAGGSNSTSTISDVEPGLLGFLVVAAIGVALVFLLRPMNKHLRKIGPGPEDVEDVAGVAAGTSEASAANEAEAGTAAADTAAEETSEAKSQGR